MIMYQLLVSLLCLGISAGLSQAQMSPAREILQQAVDRIRLENQTSEILMQLIDSKERFRERRLTFYQKIKDLGLEETLIRFTAPSNIAGVALLSWDYADGRSQQWLYLSDLKRTTRISPTQLGDSFLGTDFNYVDMKYERFMKNTYTWQKLPDSKSETVLIKTIPSEEEKASTGYGHRLITLSGSPLLIDQIQFFDPSGIELKVLRFSNYHQEEGKSLPYQIEMEDLKRKHKTRLIFLERNFKPLPDSLFNKAQLENY